MTGRGRVREVICGVAELAVPPAGVFGAGPAELLWTGERERGVVGGVEDLEVREAVGQALIVCLAERTILAGTRKNRAIASWRDDAAACPRRLFGRRLWRRG